MALLRRVEGGAEFPDRIARFIHVVENDLGLPLHQSVESSKVTLSSEQETLLDFQDYPIAIRDTIDRASFEEWIEADLDKVDAVVSEVLRAGGVSEDAVSQVFTTGGSSFVPALRGRLVKRFPDRLRGGDELTSVALGLAERARTIFGS
jgi:hypothetical chaperone protein